MPSVASENKVYVWACVQVAYLKLSQETKAEPGRVKQGRRESPSGGVMWSWSAPRTTRLSHQATSEELREADWGLPADSTGEQLSTGSCWCKVLPVPPGLQSTNVESQKSHSVRQVTDMDAAQAGCCQVMMDDEKGTLGGCKVGPQKCLLQSITKYFPRENNRKLSGHHLQKKR